MMNSEIAYQPVRNIKSVEKVRKKHNVHQNKHETRKMSFQETTSLAVMTQT